MSSVVLQCPICTKPFGVLPEQAGQVMKCPSCLQPVTIPNELADANQTASPPPPQSPSPGQLFACPACAQSFGVTSQMYGQQVGCPHCQQTVLIQSSTGTESGKSKDVAPELPASQDLFAPGYQPTQDSNPAPKKQAGKKRKSKTKSPSSSSQEKNADKTESLAVKPPAFRQPKPTKSSTESSDRESKSKNDVKSKTNPNPPKGMSSLSGPSITPILPPTVDATDVEKTRVDIHPDSSTDVDRQSHALLKDNEPTAHQQKIAAMLPPRFDVEDPENLRFKTGIDNKVFLPDGEGGIQQVDQRVLRVQHDGQDVHLVSMSAEDRSRRRAFRNTMMIVIGIIILVIAFVLLARFG